jgi:hypothetical protein
MHAAHAVIMTKCSRFLLYSPWLDQYLLPSHILSAKMLSCGLSNIVVLFPTLSVEQNLGQSNAFIYLI